MAVLSLTNAHLAFGHVALLDGANFSLEVGERVGETSLGRAEAFARGAFREGAQAEDGFEAEAEAFHDLPRSSPRRR